MMIEGNGFLGFYLKCGNKNYLFYIILKNFFENFIKFWIFVFGWDGIIGMRFIFLL